MPPARQILVYPCSTIATPRQDPSPPEVRTWTYDNNYTGWHALLGQERGSGRVSPSPPSGRLTDFFRLAPAYIDVGDLDFFRDEIIAYAAALAKADEPVELHVHPSFFA